MARQPNSRLARVIRQVFGLAGSRLAYLPRLPSCIGNQCLVWLSFPLTAAGQLRILTGFPRRSRLRGGITGPLFFVAYGEVAGKFIIRISCVTHGAGVGATAGAAAEAVGHAGEILQGAVSGAEGNHRVLCSLPAPVFRSRARIAHAPGCPLSIDPPWAWKALAAARLMLRAAGFSPEGVCIRIESNIPVGKGCGSSTADVAATLLALCSHFGLEPDADALARIAVEAEGSADGSLLPYPALFRHEEGVVEEILPGGWPPLRVMVVDTAPAGAVETLGLQRPRYSPAELEGFDALRARLRQAFAAGDAAALGSVATASARINQICLPKPHFEEIAREVERAGGHGVAAAHSGTVLALLLPPFGPDRVVQQLSGRMDRLGLPVVTEYALN